MSSAVVNHFKRSQPPSSTSDKVKSYASEVLSLGLFHEEFRDAIREGDGERVLRCWKFMLLMFKQLIARTTPLKRYVYFFNSFGTKKKQAEVLKRIYFGQKVFLADKHHSRCWINIGANFSGATSGTIDSLNDINIIHYNHVNVIT